MSAKEIDGVSTVSCRFAVDIKNREVEWGKAHAFPVLVVSVIHDGLLQLPFQKVILRILRSRYRIGPTGIPLVQRSIQREAIPLGDGNTVHTDLVDVERIFII